MATNKATQGAYSAKNITQLSERDHVRHRVGMYLGSNHHDGVTTALREIIDNSVDEAMGGYGKEIEVTFLADGTAQVQDYGRGLPVDTDDEGISGIELTLGRLRSGGKFNDSNYEASGGLNGIGASATIAVSDRAQVLVYRDGKTYELHFKEGLPGIFANPMDASSKFVPGHDLKVGKDTRSAAERKKNPTGTRVTFHPDTSVFLPDSMFDVEDIKFRMKATAFLVPSLTIVVKDYRDEDNPVEDVYQFDAGITDMVENISHFPLATKPVRLTSEGSFTVNTNVMLDGGGMERRDVERKVKVDVAFGYVVDDDSTNLRSFVNMIHTRNGGSHEAGLWRALTRVLVNHIKDNKFLKAKEEPPTNEDVKDGFVGVLSVRFAEPVFTGQEKSQLDTPQVTTVVSQVVGDELKKWIANKKNAAQVKLVCNKIVEASRIRLAAKAQKDTARKKSALERSASMPAKLVACGSSDPAEVELMICEGDSALGGLKQSRDARYTAIYPLRGKPLGTYGSPLGRILENKEWSDLIQIVGGGMGKDFDTKEMNYSRVILLADGDSDGGHIQSLLIAGFWRLMRPLVEQGRLYVALPPLFSITTQGRNKERYYALNDEELPKLITQLRKKGKKWDKVSRHKGLGEYSPDILTEIVMDPETRVLKQITMDDALETLESALELTMGPSAEARRVWIRENRALMNDEDIDLR